MAPLTKGNKSKGRSVGCWSSGRHRKDKRKEQEKERGSVGGNGHQPQSSVDRYQKAGEAFVWRQKVLQTQGEGRKTSCFAGGCEGSQLRGGERTLSSSLGKVGGESTGQPHKSGRSRLQNARSCGPRRSEPYKSRKRVWKQTDPLDFPANVYHWPLFKCNHPFIRRMEKLPICNKFGQLQMNMEVRCQALKLLLEPYLDKYRKLASNGELSGRQLHVALFENLWQLTTPSQVLLDKIGRMEMDCELRSNRKRRRVGELLDLMAQKDLKDEDIDFELAEVGPSKNNESDGEAEDDEHFASDEDDKKERVEEDEQENEEEDEQETDLLDKFSDGTNESFKMVDETRPDDGEESGRGRIDMKIWVYNHSNLALQEQFGVFDNLDSRKTVCIVECKWDKKGRDRAIYQAACYACQEALKNMNNLHFSPIYLIIVFESEWTYGILDPRGTIGVWDGKIERKSYPVFEKQESLRFKSNHTSFESLEALLNNRTRYYQQHYLNCPDAIYPCGTYLVGTLYVVDEWYKLPAFGTPGGGNAYDVHVFYEGLLRVVIGDKVTEWDMEDFEAAKGLKEKIKEIEKELFFWK